MSCWKTILLTTMTILGVNISTAISQTPDTHFNLKLKIGDQAPAWTDLPGTDDALHSLSDLKDKPIVVVCFTCRTCPTANDYETRINDFAQKYNTTDSKVALAVICVNPKPDDQLQALTKHIEDKGYEFDYLYDKSQKIAVDFGALYTPEFYVLNQQRQVVYMGAFDDATDASKVTRNYVEEAITATLEGHTPSTPIVVARGCLVKYNRSRERN